MVELYLCANVEWVPQKYEPLDAETQEALYDADLIYDLLLAKCNNIDNYKRYTKFMIDSDNNNKDSVYAKSLYSFYKKLSLKPEHRIMWLIKMDQRRLFIVKLFTKEQNQEIRSTIVHLVLAKNGKEWSIAKPTKIEVLLYNALKMANEIILGNNIILHSPEWQHINLFNCKDSKDNISLHFSGVNIPVCIASNEFSKLNEFDNKEKDLILFFSKMNEDFEHMPILDFIERYYTEESASNYVKVISKFNEDALLQYRILVIRNTNIIHYLVKIPPLYIIFHTNISNHINPFKHHTKYYQYQYIFEENGVYRITNDTMRENFFDKLIKENIIDMDSIIKDSKRVYDENTLP